MFRVKTNENVHKFVFPTVEESNIRRSWL